jgi:Domain of unknown function (DUF4383)
MAKTLCKILGVVLVLVGIAGFLKHDLLGLHLTTIHNIVHLLTAAIALYFGFYGSDATARAFCQIFGAIYLILGIVGFVAPDVVANVIQSHTATGGENLTLDNIVHLLLGAVFLIVGLLREPKPAAT